MAASETGSCTIIDEAAVQIVWQKLDILLHHPVFVECIPMRTRAEDAKEKLTTIQEFFSAQFSLSETTEWSGRLLRAMYYAEEFIDKFHLREARTKHEALRMAARPLTMLISKYKLGKDLYNLVKKMEELRDEKFLKEEAEGKGKKKPASSSSHASVPWQGKKFTRLTSFWDRQAPTNFSCREDTKKDIMKWMKAEIYTEIGIWGEEGTGKTFLARWAYSQAKYMGYECRAWIHVSPSMDKREFLLEILKRVEKLAGDVIDVKGMNIMQIKTKLFRKLAEINKFFLVLDDVQLSDWQDIWLELWMGIPDGKQSHIITTTRDKSIATFMSYDTDPIELKELNEKDSEGMLAWKLHRVPDGQILSKEKGILNMCHGLPLHISLLGGFLSSAGEHDRAALTKEGSAMTLSDILQLSCHKLPVHLKPCFIYMALFPIAFPIPTRRLVRLWLAEGLLDSHCYDIERKLTRKPEDVGEMFILELADRNVIDVVSWRADGSPKACQMLTSLYDMFRPIAMRTGFLRIHDTSKSKDRNSRDPTRQQQQLPAQLQERRKIWWLAEHTNIIRDDRGGSYCNLNLGHVSSFLSFYQRRGLLTKDISTFLRKMTSETDYSLLRVLDLEGVYKPSLQGVLCKLVLLRYLGLRSTVLDLIPSDVADLHQIETLDIKHTNITSLPSSLWKARNLRHLHLNWFYIDLKKILKACGDNDMALTKLQTLGGLVIGEVKENPMTSHVNCLTTLTTLKLFLQHSDDDTTGAGGKAVADWISLGLTNLQSLTFGVIQEAKIAGEATKADKSAERAQTTEEAEAVGEAQTQKEAKIAEEATKADKSAERAQTTEEAEAVGEAQTQKEAKIAEEATKADKSAERAQTTEEAKAVGQAQTQKEAKIAEEATKVDKSAKEAQLAEEAEAAGEGQAPKEAKPAQEAEKDDKPPKKAAPSLIGPLPELSLAEHHDLLELYLLGQLNKPNWTQLLPAWLRVLTLSGSKVEAHMMPELGAHLKQLRTFRLLANSFRGTHLTFAKHGFPSLEILKIWKLPQLVNVTIQEGAMLYLKELECRQVEKLETVQGINYCKELKTICVLSKKTAPNFVDVSKEFTNLYDTKDTKTDELSDDDDDSPS